jgi:hypothetical protein
VIIEDIEVKWGDRCSAKVREDESARGRGSDVF